jgi:hypothetical protein
VTLGTTTPHHRNRLSVALFTRTTRSLSNLVLRAVAAQTSAAVVAAARIGLGRAFVSRTRLRCCVHTGIRRVRWVALAFRVPRSAPPLACMLARAQSALAPAQRQLG